MHPFADVLYIVYLALCLFTQLSQLSIIVCSFKSYLIQYRLSRGVLHDFVGQKVALLVLQMLLRQTAETSYLRYQISDWSSAQSM